MALVLHSEGASKNGADRSDDRFAESNQGRRTSLVFKPLCGHVGHAYGLLGCATFVLRPTALPKISTTPEDEAKSSHRVLRGMQSVAPDRPESCKPNFSRKREQPRQLRKKFLGAMARAELINICSMLCSRKQGKRFLTALSA